MALTLFNISLIDKQVYLVAGMEAGFQRKRKWIVLCHQFFGDILGSNFGESLENGHKLSALDSNCH